MAETKEISRDLNQDEMAYERTEMSSERTAMAQERTAMAQERTQMAMERTELANSQTLLSYFRTAIGALAAGIGMFEFVSNEKVIMLGICLMTLAPIIAVFGIIRYLVVRKKLRDISSS